jgi:DNA-binding XRE family transcriptional regulator
MISKDGPHKLNRPPLPLSRMLRWHTTHNRQADSAKLAECQRGLEELRWERAPYGERLRELRRALGWTQPMAAMMLGISTRTVIRHERGQHRRFWVQTPMLLKLRELEATWACTLVEHLIRVKRIYPWHPSEQNRLER